MEVYVLEGIWALCRLNASSAGQLVSISIVLLSLLVCRFVAANSPQQLFPVQNIDT